MTKSLTLRAVGYRRVSTAEQTSSGAGLDAQEAIIRTEALRRGWSLLAIKTDAGVSGKTVVGRPALAAALEFVESGQADVLVVAKLDRLSRSVADFAALLDRARRENWGLVALDLGVDTTTPAGELVANVMAAVAQWERRAIGQRTREGLAARRAAGVRLGRPRLLPESTVAQIMDLRREGISLRGIAAALSSDGVPTAHGRGAWRGSSVAAVLSSRAEPCDLTAAPGLGSQPRRKTRPGSSPAHLPGRE